MTNLISHSVSDGILGDANNESKWVSRIYDMDFFNTYTCYLCRVWILVIHYDFMDDENQERRRPGNCQDLKLLQKLFRDYTDCTLVQIASPRSKEIKQILSKDGIISRFKDSTQA